VLLGWWFLISFPEEDMTSLLWGYVPVATLSGTGYVNGHLVRELNEELEGRSFGQLWDMPFTAEAPPEHLEFGQANCLFVRVHNSKANGGIWRPVLVHAPPLKAQ
jgi:hypothetical protein